MWMFKSLEPQSPAAADPTPTPTRPQSAENHGCVAVVSGGRTAPGRLKNRGRKQFHWYPRNEHEAPGIRREAGRNFIFRGVSRLKLERGAMRRSGQSVIVLWLRFVICLQTSQGGSLRPPYDYEAVISCNFM